MEIDELIELAENNYVIELNFNDHKANYRSAKYVYDPELYDQIGTIDWRGNIWSLRMYPRTAVMFFQAISNDLPALIRWGQETLEEEIKNGG